ncbi:MAG: type II toxin-antitoxin system RelE/ParE family toxin [Candidatus Schekmanbacteria bacterium]|nr:type II toxin-antitoxin system RelE/ParE family toxin [Candidatus Schekmanbacteria bacterium]
MYTIRILKPAIRELEKLDKPIGHRIVQRIKWLAENSDKTKPEALKGDLAGLYKIREGNYRIIYEIIQKERIIIIHSIGHRREVYRKK